MTRADRLGLSINGWSIKLAIRTTPVVAIEGAHGSGKTTLTHSVVATLRAQGVDATDVPESARLSPFFEAAFLYNGYLLDEWAELHLLGDQIAAEQVRARNCGLLVADRTVLNVISYWKVRFPNNILMERGVFLAARKFLLAYCRNVYDVIFLSDDSYSNSTDPIRETDEDFRCAVKAQIDEDLAELDVDMVRIPKGLSTGERSFFICEAIEAHGLLPRNTP